MSFSVDDLVSSLSSSHIGQEALDLAALQAQLAATLFCAHGPSASSSSSSATSAAAARYTCPSPMRTPSTSFMALPSLHAIDTAMNGMAGMTTPIASRRGSCSLSSPYHFQAQQQQQQQQQQHSYYPTSSSSSAFEDAMEEDERMMVEELLIPSSPVAASTSTLSSSSSSSSSFFNSTPPANQPFQSHFSQLQSQSQSQASSHPHPHSHYAQSQSQSQHYHSLDSQHPSSSSSLFTSTDPFYLAQLQASQQPHASASSQSMSVFAQNGRMAQGSRFALSAF